MSSELGRLLTVEDAAKETGISKYALYQGIHTGRIPYVRLGRCFRVPLTQLQAALAEEAKRNQLEAGEAICAGVNL